MLRMRQKAPPQHAIHVAPQSPLTALPLAAFSLAVDLASDALKAFPEPGVPPQTQLLGFVAAVLEMTRHDFAGIHSGPILLKQSFTDDGVPRYALDLYDGLVLEPHWGGDAMMPDLPSFSMHQGPIQGKWRPAASKFVSQLVEGVTAHFTYAAETRPNWRPAAAVIEALRHAPYDPRTQRILPSKSRFVFLDLICNPETASSVARLEALIARYPRLLGLRGWCGGGALHPVSRLGSRKMLQTLLRLAEDPRMQRRAGVTAREMLNCANRDGCTPLHVAKLFGQEASAEILIEAGAITQAQTRFGSISGLRRAGPSELQDPGWTPAARVAAWGQVEITPTASSKTDN